MPPPAFIPAGDARSLFRHGPGVPVRDRAPRYSLGFTPVFCLKTRIKFCMERKPTSWLMSRIRWSLSSSSRFAFSIRRSLSHWVYFHAYKN